MARYIKANALVAKFLNLEHTRNAVKDGNYLFWQKTCWLSARSRSFRKLCAKSEASH